MIAFIHTSIVEITTALIIVTEKVKTHILKFSPLASKEHFIHFYLTTAHTILNFYNTRYFITYIKSTRITPKHHKMVS